MNPTLERVVVGFQPRWDTIGEVVSKITAHITQLVEKDNLAAPEYFSDGCTVWLAEWSEDPHLNRAKLLVSLEAQGWAVYLLSGPDAYYRWCFKDHFLGPRATDLIFRTTTMTVVDLEVETPQTFAAMVEEALFDVLTKPLDAR